MPSITAAPSLLVGDVMTLDPVVIADDASIDAAVAAMRDAGVTGLPVVDDGGHLVGVISQTDLVAFAESTPIGRLVRSQPGHLRVGELMSRPPITVRLTERLPEAARRMLEHRVHRLVAIDDAGHPIGVLAAMDFVSLVAEA
jgi:CBS domain-containing protein